MFFELISKVLSEFATFCMEWVSQIVFYLELLKNSNTADLSLDDTFFFDGNKTWCNGLLYWGILIGVCFIEGHSNVCEICQSKSCDLEAGVD